MTIFALNAMDHGVLMSHFTEEISFYFLQNWKSGCVPLVWETFHLLPSLVKSGDLISYIYGRYLWSSIYMGLLKNLFIFAVFSVLKQNKKKFTLSPKMYFLL